MKVAICDLDMQFRRKLQAWCLSYFGEYGINVEISHYSSGEELLLADEPDILFLGVRLKGISGITVKEVYEKKSVSTRILFVAENRNHMAEAFGRNVYGFGIKPLDEAFLRCKLDGMIEDVCNQSQCLYCLKDSDVVKVEYKDIIYIEVSGRRTRIVVRRSKGQEEVFRVTKSLVEWERILPKEKFVRGNRRQILNLMYVVDINSQIELINEHKISIGEAYQHRVWERFHEFQSGRKGVYFYTSR